MKKKQPKAFQPVCVYDAMGFIRQLWLAVEQEGEVVRLLVSDTTKFELVSREIMDGQLGQKGSNTRYIISDHEPARIADAFRTRALQHGATPEAIRLLGQMVPLTKEDVNTMAEKLKGKGNAAALKAAAKATPVNAAKATKEVTKNNRAGNVDGLAKARAVREETGAALRAKKIKALKNKKEIEARDGTFRRQMLEDLLASKTVGEFYDKSPEDGKSKYDASCVRFGEEKGYVELA